MLHGGLGHWLLIRAYEVAEASAVQPFAYLQLVFASAHRHHPLRRDPATQCRHWRGGRGLRRLFTLWRQRVKARG